MGDKPKAVRYTLWTKPRSEWTEFPNVVMTPEIEAKIAEALAKPMSEERKARLKPYQGNSYFG